MRDRRLILVDAFVASLLFVGLFLCSGSVRGLLAQTWNYDALAYWSVDQAHPYLIPMNQIRSFLYSPVFAQAMAPLQVLPWEAFSLAWTALLVGALVWMVPGRVAILVFVPFVAMEVLSGNIHVLLAAAVVLGFRWPAAWAFVLLTKVTPGVCLAWFAARREWRSLAIALGTTLGLVVGSYALAPGAWDEWIARLTAESGSTPPGLVPALMGPLWLRVALAGVISLVAGLLGYRWPVAVACTIALPNPTLNSPAMLVALIPLVALDRRAPLEPVIRIARLRGAAGLAG
jgi:hypothetical protein